MPSGGARPGAGRPKGSKTRSNQGRRRIRFDDLASGAKLRVMPLERLLRRIEDESLDPKYRDQLCVALLPYTCSRAVALHVKASFEMTDDELAEVIAREQAYARGEMVQQRGSLRLIK